MSLAPKAGAAIDREEGGEFAPRFSADGLITCVTVDARSGEDALLARVTVGGDGGACHTGRRSCFYRRLENSGDRARLEPIAKS